MPVDRLQEAFDSFAVITAFMVLLFVSAALVGGIMTVNQWRRSHKEKERE